MKYLFKTLLLLFVLFSMFVFSSLTPISTEAQPLINEFMASNTTTINDEDGEYSDWIELYNSGDSQVNLAGYGLSDRPDNLFKWIFPGVILEPGQFLLVFASGKDRTTENLHTNFRISADGETLVLTDNAGVFCDSVYTKVFGTDISMGRKPDGGEEWVIFSTPTPGISNTDEGYQGYTDAVVEMSLPGGFYDDSISLELSVSSPNAKIRYILDGSEPSDSSEVYSAPLSINSTTVIRARAFEEGLFPGSINTQTYFINDASTLPVISISTNPENFWDDDIGIYVRGNSTKWGGYPDQPVPPPANWNEDWERPVHIEFYVPDGSLGFSIDAGVKIFGKYSRAYPKKSLSVFARAKYGYTEMDHQIFPELPITEFRSIILRNGGNDWYLTLFRDSLHQRLMSALDLEVQAYRPAVVFLNGDYWGIHNVREKINEEYLASHHSVDPDRVDMLDDYHANFLADPVNGVTSIVIEGTADHYNALIDYILEHDLSDPAHYEYVKTQIEVDNFIDYMVSRIYISCPDGPGHNTKLWRPQTPTGKWRWLMYDTDHGSGYIGNPAAFGLPGLAYSSNLIEYYSREFQLERSPDANFMMYSLLKNSSFKHDFANRYADYLNTIYSTEQVMQKVQEIIAVLEPEMPKNIKRWSEAIFSMSEWYSNIAVLEEFFEKRPYYARQNLVNEFNLSGTANVNLDVSQSDAGKIKINTLTLEKYPWTGIYFQDIPVKLSALPNPGYTFTGWTGVDVDTANFPSITVTLTEDTTITAHFEEDSAAINTIVINEINYNSSSDVDPDDWVELYNAYSVPVYISGWIFMDEDDAHTFVIPEDTFIEAGGYLVLCRVESLFHEVFPEINKYIGSFNFGLNNAGETVRLFNSNGDLVDSLTYDDEAPWPVEPDGNGPTLSLLNPIRNNTLPEYWSASNGNGTPGEKNDVYSSVDEDAEPDVPIAFSLGQNYPNPFNSITTIPYSVPASGRVAIEVYSILGRRVLKILDEKMTPGQYNVVFKPDNLASGLYIYTIKAGNFYQTKQMMLMK